jgi:hypothetical protein
MGTPPAGDTSTAGSSSSRIAIRSAGEHVGDESRSGGVGVKPAPRARGLRPLCVNQPREAQPSTLRPEGGPSLLDRERITRPDVPDRRTWLGEVERVTDEHRTNRARKHWRRAVQIKAERLAAGRSYEEAIEGARWHQRRAYGQVNRFVGVLDCGTEKFWLVCEACSRVKERSRECRVALLCVSCRAAIGEAKRSRFRLARRRALSRVKDLYLHRLGRHGGRWSEKLLTLTLPHLAVHTARQRIEFAFRALFLFRKAFKKWLRSCPHSGLVAWFRTFEWTPGSDGRGHPHFHFWLLSPYLDVAFLRQAWAQALHTAGFPRRAVEDVYP